MLLVDIEEVTSIMKIIKYLVLGEFKMTELHMICVFVFFSLPI